MSFKLRLPWPCRLPLAPICIGRSHAWANRYRISYTEVPGGYWPLDAPDFVTPVSLDLTDHSR